MSGMDNAMTLAARRNARHEAWIRRIPLLPALVFLIILTQIPFLATVIISFIGWNALYPNDLVYGTLENYVVIFNDPFLRHSVWATIELTVVVVVVSAVLGLAIALLLNRKFIGRGIVRTMMIAPFLIVPVAAALVWKHALLNPDFGLINGVLTWIWGLFGSTAAPQLQWISSYPMAMVCAVLVWEWTPFMMLILLAGLQSRPADIIEAARLSGATPWQIFRYVTLPHLRRYIDLAVLLGAIYIVQNFDAVFTVTSGGLGTANLPYTIYQEFFVAHDYGAASAAGVVVLVGTLIISMFALRSVSSLLSD